MQSIIINNEPKLARDCKIQLSLVVEQFGNEFCIQFPLSHCVDNSNSSSSRSATIDHCKIYNLPTHRLIVVEQAKSTELISKHVHGFTSQANVPNNRETIIRLTGIRNGRHTRVAQKRISLRALFNSRHILQ